MFVQYTPLDVCVSGWQGIIMSDEFDCDFSGAADAKAEIRLAVEYLLGGTTGTARADILREIIEIVRDVANGRTSEQSDPLDDGLPGG